MKTIVLLLAVAACAGCSHTKIERTADGITARNTRVFWSSEGIAIEYPTTNGVAKAVIKKSSTSEAAMDAFKTGLELGKEAVKKVP